MSLNLPKQNLYIEIKGITELGLPLDVIKKRAPSSAKLVHCIRA